MSSSPVPPGDHNQSRQAVHPKKTPRMAQTMSRLAAQGITARRCNSKHSEMHTMDEPPGGYV